MDAEARRDSVPIPYEMKLRDLLKTYLVLTSGMVASKGLSFFSGALLGRSLGASQLGWFGAAVTIVAYLLILTNMGMDSLGTKLVAEFPANARSVAKRVRGTRLALALTLGGIGSAVAINLGVPVPIVVSLALVATALAFRDDWLLFALGHERVVSAGAVVRELTYLVLIVAVVARTKSLAAACLSYLIAECVWSAFTQGAVRQLTDIGTRGVGELAPSLAKRSWPIAVMGIMSITYTKFDTPMIAMMRGPSDAGVYYAGYGIMFAALSLSAPLGRAAVPLMARARAQTGEGGLQATLRTSLLGTVLGCVVAACIIPAPGELLRLAFGDAFVRGGQALAILAVSLAATFGSTILLQRLVVDERQHLLAVIAAGAALTNIGLNLALIPRFGIQGAAFATVVSEVFILTCGLIAHKHIPGVGRHVLRVLWALCALSLAILIGQAVRVSPWPLRALVSSGTVLVVCAPLLLWASQRWRV
jgi:O-antigen/teichoic acid export membrane protein